MPEIDVLNGLNTRLKERWVKNGSLGPLAGKKTSGFFYHLAPSHEFDLSKVGLVLVDMAYPADVAEKVARQPIILGRGVYKNPAKSTIKDTLKYSKQTQEMAEWHVDGGLKITAGAKFTAGVPLIGSADVSLSAELSVSAGTKASTTNTSVWEDTIEITIPPESNVYATVLLSVGTLANVPFTARLKAVGDVGAAIQRVYHDGPIIYPDDYQIAWANMETGVGWYSGGSFAPLGGPLLEVAQREFVVTGTFTGTYSIDKSVFTSPDEPKNALAEINARE